jgi:hypothetical protein
MAAGSCSVAITAEETLARSLPNRPRVRAGFMKWMKGSHEPSIVVGALVADSSHSLHRSARLRNRCQLPPVAQGIVAKSAHSTDNLRPSTITHGFGSACRTCSSGPGMRVAPLGLREEQP